MNNFPDTVLCAISNAEDGNMDFRFGESERVIAARTQFLKKHGVSYEEHIAMRCDHGDIITHVTSFHAEVGARSQEEQVHSEVLVTQDKRLPLMLFTADCQPTSFYDPVTETIALAHISRTTLCNKLSEKTINFMRESFGTNPEDLLVHIGPSIQKESYRFPLPLEEIHGELKDFIEEKDGYAHIDLIGAHLRQLHASGIPQGNISVSKEDTASDAYFSYFKMKQEGRTDDARMATILMLK